MSRRVQTSSVLPRAPSFPMSFSILMSLVSSVTKIQDNKRLSIKRSIYIFINSRLFYLLFPENEKKMFLIFFINLFFYYHYYVHGLQELSDYYQGCNAVPVKATNLYECLSNEWGRGSFLNLSTPKHMHFTRLS